MCLQICLGEETRITGWKPRDTASKLQTCKLHTRTHGWNEGWRWESNPNPGGANHQTTMASMQKDITIYTILHWPWLQTLADQRMLNLFKDLQGTHFINSHELLNRHSARASTSYLSCIVLHSKVVHSNSRLYVERVFLWKKDKEGRVRWD